MAARKKFTSAQKFVIVIGCIVVAQVVFYFYFKGEDPKSMREKIDELISEQTNLTPERRSQLKIQLALSDYMVANNNVAPATLEELVPKYFDRVPTNPRTQEPFEYKIINNRPYVGGAEEEKVVASSSGGSSISDLPEEELLIAALDENAVEERFIYDPREKRDPFRPFNFAPIKPARDGATPLETYDIGQLKLTAVLDGLESPKAIIENQAGRGFTIEKGTRIGVNGGQVVEIEPDRVLILETFTDFTGQQKTKTIEMKLRTPDQESRLNELKAFSNLGQDESESSDEETDLELDQ